jgi:hypothetical protein
MENEDEQSGLMDRIRKFLPNVRQEHLDAEAKESPLTQYLEENLGEEIPEHLQGAVEAEYSKLAPKGWEKANSADDGTTTGPDQQMAGTSEDQPWTKG